MRWWRQATPFGDVVVVTSDHGLVRVVLDASPGLVPIDGAPDRDDDVARELDEYLAGTRRRFTIRPDLTYADPDRFPRRVLETLVREVPWGETVTYGELADMAGAPRAARAVGNVMAHNPVPLVIPCHRVVAANGIGGYGPAGVAAKRALLALEGIDTA
jgi:methylated-DNA-[protein]-cysteine S-methyltransferase